MGAIVKILLKKARSRTLLWVTDPWLTLDHPRDTTLRLIEESGSLGNRNYWCDVHSIRWDSGRVCLEAAEVEHVAPSRGAVDFHFGPCEEITPADFDSIQYRTDPPVDLAYLHPLQLLILGLADHPGTEIVNDPETLCAASSKVECLLFGDCAPPSVISSKLDVLASFGSVERLTIVKPLHGAQGASVELLDWRSVESVQRAREVLDAVTDGFRRPVMLQRYLSEIAQGEKRLWFVDGDILSCCLKRPKAGRLSIDTEKGDLLEPTRLTVHEELLAARIGIQLLRKHIRIAAVDLVGGYVTDYNFSSPGLLTQMELVTGRNLARQVVSALGKPIQFEFRNESLIRVGSRGQSGSAQASEPVSRGRSAPTRDARGQGDAKTPTV
jgi:glutathione synthase